MHPINKLLSFVNLRLIRQNKVPIEFISDYKNKLSSLKKNPPEGFQIFEEMFCETGAHPKSLTDYECEFAANHLANLKPRSILDIGSYREFILGLVTHLRVTTVDVRERPPATPNETVITCDAKNLELPSETFDAIISLCSIEHFGLGRYGDDFDLAGDRKAIQEMIRVLRPGGHLIFSTQLTMYSPAIVFNAHRIYSYQMVKELCSGLTCVEESFYSNTRKEKIALAQVTDKPPMWDLYCGCWKK